jgi:hypothetical protein
MYMLFLIVPTLVALSAAATNHPHIKHCIDVSNVAVAGRGFKGRVAVGISGVSRGINYTLPSIQRHVFDVLRNANFDFDVIWSSVSNPDYFGHQMNEYEFLDVLPCLFSIEPQEYVLRKEWYRFCANRGYACRDTYLAIHQRENFTESEVKLYGHKHSKYVRQLQYYFCSFDTQSRLAGMIRTHASLNKFTYDAVLLIRPDVAFIRDIDLPDKFADIQQNKFNSTVWIPDFQNFKGVNDRAAFGSQAAMLKYLERGETYMNNNSYRIGVAEGYLKKFMENEGLVTNPSTMRFMRVRPMEDEGADVGVIVHFDSNPKYLNVPWNDPDLLRCAGNTTKMHVKKQFEYKTIQADVC